MLLLQYLGAQSSIDSLFIISASSIFASCLGSLTTSFRCFGRLPFSLRLLGALVVEVLLTAFISVVFSTLTRIIFPPTSRLLLVSLIIVLIFARVLLIRSLIRGSAASFAGSFPIATLIRLLVIHLLLLAIIKVEVRICLFVIATVATAASATLLARLLLVRLVILVAITLVVASPGSSSIRTLRFLFLTLVIVNLFDAVIIGCCTGLMMKLRCEGSISNLSGFVLLAVAASLKLTLFFVRLTAKVLLLRDSAAVTLF